MTALFKRSFWHSWLSYIKINVFFWNPEIKLDKTGTFFVRKIWIWDFDLIHLAWLTLTFSWIKFTDECRHRILLPKWPIKHVSHDTHATFWFGDLIWPELDLDLYLHSIRPILICYILHHLRSLLAGFGLAVVISSISVANKEKSIDFDPWPDLSLTCYR